MLHIITFVLGRNLVLPFFNTVDELDKLLALVAVRLLMECDNTEVSMARADVVPVMLGCGWMNLLWMSLHYAQASAVCAGWYIASQVKLP